MDGPLSSFGPFVLRLLQSHVVQACLPVVYWSAASSLANVKVAWLFGWLDALTGVVLGLQIGKRILYKTAKLSATVQCGKLYFSGHKESFH